MKLGLGVRRRRKTRKTLKKTSRKRKGLIPVGKQLGGYKKACKHQHQWHLGGLKKRSREVKESESGKTHKPFGSKTGGLSEEEVEERDFLDNVPTVEKLVIDSDDDDATMENLEKEADEILLAWVNEPYDESETEKRKEILERRDSNIIRPSKEYLEFSGNMPYYIDPNSLLDVDFGDMYADKYGMPGFFKTYAAEKSKGAYGPPYNELYEMLYGREAHKAWIEREFCKLYGTMDYYSESDSDSDSDSDSNSIPKTPRWSWRTMLSNDGALYW